MTCVRRFLHALLDAVLGAAARLTVALHHPRLAFGRFENALKLSLVMFGGTPGLARLRGHAFPQLVGVRGEVIDDESAMWSATWLHCSRVTLSLDLPQPSSDGDPQRETKRILPDVTPKLCG